MKSIEILCLLRSIPMINGWKFRENPWNSHLHWLSPSCFNVFFLVNSHVFQWKNLEKSSSTAACVAPPKASLCHRRDIAHPAWRRAPHPSCGERSGWWLRHLGNWTTNNRDNRVYSWDDFGYYLFFFNVFIHILSIPRPSLIALFGSHL